VFDRPSWFCSTARTRASPHCKLLCECHELTGNTILAALSAVGFKVFGRLVHEYGPSPRDNTTTVRLYNMHKKDSKGRRWRQAAPTPRSVHARQSSRRRFSSAPPLRSRDGSRDTERRRRGASSRSRQRSLRGGERARSGASPRHERSLRPGSRSAPRPYSRRSRPAGPSWSKWSLRGLASGPPPRASRSQRPRAPSASPTPTPFAPVVGRWPGGRS
jgi:hypothetical protein